MQVRILSFMMTTMKDGEELSLASACAPKALSTLIKKEKERPDEEERAEPRGRKALLSFLFS